MSKALIKWSHEFCEQIGWPFIPIAKIKISKMARYKGLCICDGEEFYIVLSETANKNNHEFFATLVHELIHAVLWVQGYKFAHKHKKEFKRLAKDVQNKTFYTVKDILK